MTVPIRFSEHFFSAQGEGKYVGIPSLWLRFYLCNLRCDGFGQDKPTEPSTWELPYQTIDIADVTDISQLPVFSKGCDSSYSWSKRYRHLVQDRTAEQTVDELTELLPTGTFVHQATGQNTDMVFTGGEPMLKNNQMAMDAVMREFHARNNMPHRVTVETNGTKEISPELIQLIDDMHMPTKWGGLHDEHSSVKPEWFWSVSPKLWNTAGEPSERAIKPEVVAGYAKACDRGQLKFVVNGTSESWQEVLAHTEKFREVGVEWPVYIMAVGGTVEGLRLSEAQIADEAIQRGYFYTSRMQNHIYGNSLGK